MNTRLMRNYVIKCEIKCHLDPFEKLEFELEEVIFKFYFSFYSIYFAYFYAWNIITFYQIICLYQIRNSVAFCCS